MIDLAALRASGDAVAERAVGNHEAVLTSGHMNPEAPLARRPLRSAGIDLGIPDGRRTTCMFTAVQQDRRVGQRGKATMTFRGVVIAEALKDPALVEKLSVYRARITDEGVPIDYEGHTGRWHLYWIEADQETISFIQRQTKRGWYAHFWEGDRLLVIYDDAVFELSRDNPPSWRSAIEHGVKQGIPRGELDFVTED